MSCGEALKLSGSTIQTVTIVGYADNKIHIGCLAKAGVTTTLTRRYNCLTDSTVFLCDGAGAAYEFGDTKGLATVGAPSVTTPTLTMSVIDPVSMACGASSTTSGYGLTYTGEPISFSSGTGCTMISLELIPVTATYYLQSFRLNMPSGQIPTASYTLVTIFKGGV